MLLSQQLLKTNLATFFQIPVLSRLSLYLYDTIPSTNQTLWELLDKGEKLPIAAIASQQSAGRGQWGRTWQSSPGGLYLSVALSCHIHTQNAFHLTLLSAWGIATVLRQYHIRVGLKWPNDLILQGKKLGGIKSETRIQGETITQAVIGIGINWSNHVPETGINLNSFLTEQIEPSIISLEQLAAITLYGVFNGYQCYLEQGCDRLLSSYLEILTSIGHSVTVEGVPGTVIGVTAQGDLKVRFHAVGTSTEVCLPPGSIRLGYEK